MRPFDFLPRRGLLAVCAVAALGLGACAQPPLYNYQAGAIPPAPRPMEPQPTHYVLHADALFDFDSSQLRPDGQRELAAVARKIRGAQVRSIVVIGYTDRIGSPDYNLSLSRRRAEAAAAALAANGVPPQWIESRGRGSSDPVAGCAEAPAQGLVACLEPNRRVEIIVHASGS